jgi:diguanylate cyclase (GGDEF)-like protein
VKQLLERATELEVNSAMGSNPLTNLPGNRAIHSWLEEALCSGVFTVVYCDLNSFKQYNDVYGFLLGDEMIRLTARVLLEVFEEPSLQARVGHIGGDDFVVVAKCRLSDEVLGRVCDRFDEIRIEMFSPEHMTAGGFTATSRTEEVSFFRLTTLSLAAVDDVHLGDVSHLAVLGEIAASLKKKAGAKALGSGRSSFAREERFHSGGIQAPGEGTACTPLPREPAKGGRSAGSGPHPPDLV